MGVWLLWNVQRLGQDEVKQHAGNASVIVEMSRLFVAVILPRAQWSVVAATSENCFASTLLKIITAALQHTENQEVDCTIFGVA